MLGSSNRYVARECKHRRAAVPLQLRSSDFHHRCGCGMPLWNQWKPILPRCDRLLGDLGGIFLQNVMWIGYGVTNYNSPGLSRCSCPCVFLWHRGSNRKGWWRWEGRLCGGVWSSAGLGGPEWGLGRSFVWEVLGICLSKALPILPLVLHKAGWTCTVANSLPPRAQIAKVTWIAGVYWETRCTFPLRYTRIFVSSSPLESEQIQRERWKAKNPQRSDERMEITAQVTQLPPRCHHGDLPIPAPCMQSAEKHCFQ